MRQIKFRAYDKKEKFMFNVDEMKFLKEMTLIRGSEDGCFISGHDFEIMQFTGLKDKNGKEIYEGDIVKVDKHTGCFKVENFKGGLYFRHYKEKDWDIQVQRNFYHLPHTVLEVIGNIYENPELLSKAN